MSTEKKTKKVLTDDEKITNALDSLSTAIVNKEKNAGKSPEYTFGNKIPDALVLAWKSGDIPNAQSVKDEAISLGTQKTSLAPGALVTKATKLMAHALYLSKIESFKTKIKKDNKDISDKDLANKLSPLIDELDTSLVDKRVKAEAEAKKKKEEADAKKKTESTSK